MVGDARRSVDETRARRARAALLKEEKEGEKRCQWCPRRAGRGDALGLGAHLMAVLSAMVWRGSRPSTRRAKRAFSAV